MARKWKDIWKEKNILEKLEYALKDNCPKFIAEIKEKCKTIDNLWEQGAGIIFLEETEVLEVFYNDFFNKITRKVKIRMPKKIFCEVAQGIFCGNNGEENRGKLLTELDRRIEEGKRKNEKEKKEACEEISNRATEKREKIKAESGDALKKHKKKKMVWAIALGVLVLVAIIVSGLAIYEDFDKDKQYGLGIAGTVVDVLGLLSGIAFFIWEHLEDSAEEERWQQLIDAVARYEKSKEMIQKFTLIEAGAVGENAKVFQPVAEGGTAQAADTINYNQCPFIEICKTKKMIEEKDGDKDKKEMVADCSRCRVEDSVKVKCEACGYEMSTEEKKVDFYTKDSFDFNINGRLWINEQKVNLSKYSSRLGDNRPQTVIFGPEVQEIELGKDSVGNGPISMQCIDVFADVKVVAFAKKEKPDEDGYELGEKLFDGMCDKVKFYGLHSVKKVGAHCFGGVGEDKKSPDLQQAARTKFLDDHKFNQTTRNKWLQNSQEHREWYKHSKAMEKFLKAQKQ